MKVKPLNNFKFAFTQLQNSFLGVMVSDLEIIKYVKEVVVEIYYIFFYIKLISEFDITPYMFFFPFFTFI